MTHLNTSLENTNVNRDWTKEELQDFIQQMIDTEMEQKVLPLQTMVQNTLPKATPQEIPSVEEPPPVLPNKEEAIPTENSSPKIHQVEDTIIVETTKPPIIDAEALKKEIRNFKNRVSKAKSRIKKGEGNPETHQATIKNMEEMIRAKNKQLKALKNGHHSV